MTHRGGACEAGTTTRGVRRSTAFLSIFLMAMFALVGMSGSPASADPQGNDGTVKLNSIEFGNGPGHSGGSGGTPGTPSNDPHIPCSFDIEWFQFQGGETSAVTFELWSPTKKDRSMGVSGTTSGIVLGAPGAAALNHTEPYTLSFTGAAHPVHGYHVKITVNTEDSKPGNADVKHKVFWVEGCEDETPPQPPQPPEPPEGEEDEVSGPKDKPEQGVQVAGEQVAVAPPAPAEVPTAVNAGLGESVSAQSGSSPLGLVLVTLGALLTAAAAARRRARA